MQPPIRTLLGAIVLVALNIGPALADDFRNRDAWDFKVRRNPTATARATTMWQVEQLSKAQAAASSTATSPSVGESVASSAGAGSVPSVSSVANMNIITIAVGDGGTADVAIETEQANHGKVDGTAVAATGQTVDIGTIK